MLQIGFVGYGRFARLRKDILSQSFSDKTEIIGYHDIDDLNQADICYFPDLNVLLQSCNAIFISVPPKFAPGYVEVALKAGCHVFCEKPAAINARELDGIIKLRSEDESRVLAYGFNHRRHESLRLIKSYTDEKLLGNLLWIRGRYGKEVDQEYKNTWRCNPELNGGGILIDQGIHMVDLVDWIAGGFDMTSAIFSNNFLKLDGIEDNAFVNLASSSTSVSVSLHSTVTQWRYLFALECFYEKGSIVLNGLRTSSGVYGPEILSIKPNDKFRNEVKEEQMKYEANTSWQDEVEAFINAINSSTQYPYTGLIEAVRITKLIDDIYAEGKWI